MAQYDFDGKVAFVTGAARGQGRSHAVSYAENGADVVVTDICETTEESKYELSGEEELAETVDAVESRGRDALAVKMDVSKEAEVEYAVEEALSEFGRIDILANNAGIAPVSGLMDLDEATWDATLDVNLKGMWLCAKHVGRHMIERGGGGRIVNTSSVAGMASSPGLGHYTAAKHGVIGLTKTLAMELAPHDVTVNAVCPSAVDTAMTSGIVETIDDDIAEIAEQSGPDNVLGDIIQAEDVSAAFMWLSSDDARFVTGIALPVAAGATAV
ncbi:mycofactocin-coupled SDR family oxidoreductase [Halegenticoccus soli]|uniref:mycofactocin-coupled SDR family oxidoreductase n=1 Tax=Halegenticoccus soli TaxID=1985678 RepID=UPI000C6E1B96|nr:mycofactocin-coupled SDR family oxidoreductase [Halegenticoccus soli]